jgi:CRISPR-associated protein Cas1
MYAMRFAEMLPTTDLNALRGLEGVRVKAMYEHEARKAGITWRGRRYDRQNPTAADAPNQALNHVATAAEACALVACAAVGALPELGFVHEDADSAFALDVADLYRQTFTVAVAFRAAAEAERTGEDLERIARRHAGEAARRTKLVSGMIDRIKELLDADDGGGDP